MHQIKCVTSFDLPFSLRLLTLTASSTTWPSRLYHDVLDSQIHLRHQKNDAQAPSFLVHGPYAWEILEPGCTLKTQSHPQSWSYRRISTSLRHCGIAPSFSSQRQGSSSSSVPSTGSPITHGTPQFACRARRKIWETETRKVYCSVGVARTGSRQVSRSIMRKDPRNCMSQFAFTFRTPPHHSRSPASSCLSHK